MMSKPFSDGVPENVDANVPAEHGGPDAAAPDPCQEKAEECLSPNASTKMSQAIEIYRRMTRKKGTTRREIIEVFMEKVGLSKAGASTYYQMIKKRRRQD